MDLRHAVRKWAGRLGRPLSAAVVFCAAGLACAVFAVGVNRILASRPRPPAIAVVPQSSQAPSGTPAPATPTPATAVCNGAVQATGDLEGMNLLATTPVVVTSGASTLQVIVPAGAVLHGSPNDVQVQLAGGGRGQRLRGTLVDDVALCVQAGSGSMRITVRSGDQVSGTVVPAASGLQARDLRFSQPDDGGD